MSKSKKKIDFVIEDRFIIKIYLKKKRFCVAKSELLEEELLDVFYSEINNDEKVMEFGNFYFLKEEFHYAKVIKKRIKIKKEEE